MTEHFDPWVIWLVAGLALILADLLLAGGTSGVLLLLGLTALAGMAAALLGLGLTGQLAVAGVAGLLLLPVVLWFMRRMSGGRSGTARRDTRVGGETYVVERWGERLGIRVLGDFFPVRLVDPGDGPAGDRPLAPGERVRVLRFSGITAEVCRVADADRSDPADARRD
ncbi:NfeD family protein [Alkalilimnicola ehrlichii MLHE-1]|uniref:NfeD-like C-terminal domain-containing protein n=1 Tax=Alkalilimnicola ehrlichii (strain ATCC BAA-1101 / DSM 17681 / MLHE-1) TaxID=187272 RepID=Q0AB87_ALKEH|nr:NfeD family protein [Alkalilimnicola ehrlichii]ABI55900.1 protein of unknown function DUF107 [Alkalilimnicola ehrlichii MLHE-1]